MVEVTIIVPIYNVEKYVKKCVDSLLAQDFKNYEIWAIDDGSPDNSKELIKNLYKENEKVILIEKENGGYGSVLEYAISKIKSKYFIICDPDDWLSNNALSILYDAAEKNNLDMVLADKYNVFVDSNEQIYQKTFCNNIYCIKPNVVYDNSDVYKFSTAQVSPHAKLYKTDLCKNISFSKKVSHTDFTLFQVALMNCKRVMYIDKALAYYLNDRPGNTVTDYSYKKIESYIVVWKHTFKQIIESNNLNGYSLLAMYLFFKSILSEYSIMNGDKEKDVFVEFYDISRKLSSYKKDIMRYNKEKLLKKIMGLFLINKNASKITIKLYIKIKGIKMKL